MIEREGVPDENIVPEELRYFRLALQALIGVSALVGLVFFTRDLSMQAPILHACSYFIPTAILFSLLMMSPLLTHFFSLMVVLDFQTWIFIFALGFSFFLLYKALGETNAVRSTQWFSAFTGVFGFAAGIPIGRFVGRK